MRPQYSPWGGKSSIVKNYVQACFRFQLPAMGELWPG